VVADARTVLDQAAQAVTSLDGDPQVVAEIARMAAENGTIQRLWVANGPGSIVSFGKGQPAPPAIERLAPDPWRGPPRGQRVAGRGLAGRMDSPTRPPQPAGWPPREQRPALPETP